MSLTVEELSRLLDGRDPKAVVKVGGWLTGEIQCQACRKLGDRFLGGRTYDVADVDPLCRGGEVILRL